MTAFYFEYRTGIFVAALVLPVLVCAWHFLAIGPTGQELASFPQTVIRFGFWHRLVHWLRALGFVLSVITGCWLAYQTATPMVLTTTHMVVGRVFVMASIVSMAFLIKYSVLRAYDVEWLRHLGGYLTKRHNQLRAGKFNAGQKVFIWLGLLIAIALAATGSLLEASKGSAAWHGGIRACHGLLAISTAAVVIGHVYLSLVAVSGTWQVLFHGRVAKEWLSYHHPDDESVSSSVRSD